MNEKTIRALIKLVEESNVDQLEVSSWGRKVRITRRLTSGNGHSDLPLVVGNISPSPVAAAAPVAQAPPPVAEAPPETEKQYIEIKSPMVGTYYSAPAPDVSPYVTANQQIKIGQVVCIVEAMKLMNEIESEVGGRIAKIMVENAQPIEFGQVLFLIDPQG